MPCCDRTSRRRSGTRQFVAVCCLVVGLGGRPCSLPAAEPVRLTQDGRFKCSPVVCAEGREIVYAELANPTLYRLMKLTIEDSTSRPLHPEAKTSEFEPAFSTAGINAAFMRTSADTRVYMMIADK